MPFVTEELWQHLRPRADGDSILRQELPTADRSLIDPGVEAQMGFVQRTIEAVRQIRSEKGIPPGQAITLEFRTGPEHPEETLRQYEGYFQRLARVQELIFLHAGSEPRPRASAVVDGEEIFVPLFGLIDIGAEHAKLGKEIDRLQKMVAAIKAKLANAHFLARAPKDVVDREKEKLASFEPAIEKLNRSRELLHSRGGDTGG